MMIMRKMTTTVLISMLTGAMAILISGCSNNSTSQSTKTTSTSADTQAASSENTTAKDITTTVDGSAENVTSIKKVVILPFRLRIYHSQHLFTRLILMELRLNLLH